MWALNSAANCIFDAPATTKWILRSLVTMIRRIYAEALSTDWLDDTAETNVQDELIEHDSVRRDLCCCKNCIGELLEAVDRHKPLDRV